jgi:hypothetical protein
VTRGVLFAITDETVASLLAADGDDEVMQIVEALEDAWEKPFYEETDKAWDAIHRALSDGTLDLDAGAFPRDYAPEYGADDREYTISIFRDVVGFYARAAEAKRAVIFTVSQ